MLDRNRGDRLTLRFIRSIDRPGRYGDGHGSRGLSLVVRERAGDGFRCIWTQRITNVDGKKISIGLGGYPEITLKNARILASDNARQIALGEDPRKPRRSIPTVAEAFDQVIALRTPTWTGEATALSWRASKAKYCEAILSKRISDVTPADVLSILEPIWHDKGATAKNVKAHLSAVMDWAVQMEFRANNPAHPRVTRSLGPQLPPDHHQAAPYQDLGQYLAQVRDSDNWWAERYCLLFMAFTADRSGEAREATWDEIDFDEAVWTIPARRMKARQGHMVPLSKQAIEILRFAQLNGHHSKGIIFPPKRGGASIRRGRLAKLVKRLGLPFVPHGLRSSFRDWAGERDDINQDVAEAALAHAIGNTTRRAYLRTNFFAQRRNLMQEWADFLTETMGPVISPHDQDPDQDQDQGQDQEQDPDHGATDLDCPTEAGRQISFDQLLAFDQTVDGLTA